MNISAKFSYLGLIVAAIMFFYGILGIISGLASLIVMGMHYGLDDTPFVRITIQNLLSGIVLVTPGSIVLWKSKMVKGFLRK